MTTADFPHGDQLRDAGFEVALRAGQTLFEQGDESDGAYVVVAGSVAVLEGGEQVDILDAG